jgi:hypothetical protein
LRDISHTLVKGKRTASKVKDKKDKSKEIGTVILWPAGLDVWCTLQDRNDILIFHRRRVSSRSRKFQVQKNFQTTRSGG